MSEVSKPDYRYMWSSGGANVSPSSTKIQTGWTSEVPPYQWENYLQNRQDSMLVHLNQHGIPQWDALTEYFANKSYTLGSDGLVYKAVQSSGPATTTQDPTTDASDTYWRVAFADAGVNYLTQSTADTRYLQRANNLSDVTNASTARSNIGVLPATTSVAGLMQIATQAEVNSGVESTKAVTPATLAVLKPRKAQCTAWASFNGTGTAVLRSAYNITNLVDNAVGNYSFSFIAPMDTPDYAISSMASGMASAQAYTLYTPEASLPTTSGLTLVAGHGQSSIRDPLYASFSIFGGRNA